MSHEKKLGEWKEIIKKADIKASELRGRIGEQRKILQEKFKLSTPGAAKEKIEELEKERDKALEALIEIEAELEEYDWNI